MIFGQGAIRCHPFIQQEMDSLQIQDQQLALQQFDTILFKHIGFILHNIGASLWLGLSNARFISVPGDKNSKRYYRQIARLSVGFALLADYALLTLGGKLKIKERISGRFADVLSNLYLCSTVLKHFQDQGCQEDDLPLLHWACQQTIYRAQQSLLALFYNLPLRPLTHVLRVITFPTGKPFMPPGDQLIHQTASLLLVDSLTRDRLTQGIYINHEVNDPTGRIEVAFKAVLAAAPVEAKIRKAQKQKLLAKGDIMQQVDKAIEANVINQAEAELLNKAERARLEAIRVDDFSPEELIQ